MPCGDIFILPPVLVPLGSACNLAHSSEIVFVRIACQLIYFPMHFEINSVYSTKDAPRDRLECDVLKYIVDRPLLKIAIEHMLE